MVIQVPRRLSHAFAIIVLPAWNWLALGSITLLGIVDTVRADVFSWIPQVPHLPVAWWVAVFLLALVIFVFNSSYQSTTDLEEKLALAKEASSALRLREVRAQENQAEQQRIANSIKTGNPIVKRRLTETQKGRISTLVLENPAIMSHRIGICFGSTPDHDSSFLASALSKAF